MSAFFSKFDSLNHNVHDLILGFVGSAIFAISIVIGRFIFKRLTKGGTKMARMYADNLVLKYEAHHAIFGAKDLPESLRLFFLVILTSIAWLMRAGIILDFFYGVKALISGQWFICLGHWFALNCLLEGFFWAKDSRNDKIPKAILEEKQKQNQIPAETKQS